MIRPPPRSPLFPYTTLFRSDELQSLTYLIAGPPAMVDGVVGTLHAAGVPEEQLDRKSTRLNSSHVRISYAVFCLKKNIVQRMREPPVVERRLGRRRDLDDRL